jgi:dihydropteroate synthase
MSTKSNEILRTGYSFNGKSLTFIKPVIMAIVNITPDSFYDGGKFDTLDDVLRDVEQKVTQGAGIIDIGAASSRPNAAEINEETELKRLMPALEIIRKNFPEALISVDTYRANVAKESALRGADIINDISGGRMDDTMVDTIAALNLPYILMHLDGTPQTTHHQAEYTQVVTAVKESLLNKVKVLESRGFTKIILDPGFGFGKSLVNNYQLLKHLSEFDSIGYPLLAGISRKSMINKVLGTNPVTALNGTTVLNTIALLNGAKLLRVHDVNEAKQAIELVEFYKNA